MRGKRVVTIDVDTGATTTVLALEDAPSGIGFLPDGTPLVVSMFDRRLLRLGPSGAEVHADLTEVPGDFLNDMVVDADGRAYVGMRWLAARPGLPPDTPGTLGSLLSVEPDRTVVVQADGILAANGMVITADGAQLVIAETYAHRLTMFDRDDTGTLSARRVFANVYPATPDGITLDCAGGIWIGSPYTQELLRVAAGGTVTDRYSTARGGGVACMLGGADRRTLFVMNADPRAFAGATQVVQQLRGAGPPATDSGGSVTSIRVDEPGAGRP